MKVKQYFGANLQEALQRAKVELGEDILLIESSTIPLKKVGERLESITQITIGYTESNLSGKNSLRNIPYPFKEYLEKENGKAPKFAQNGGENKIFNKVKKEANTNYKRRSYPEELISLFDRLVKVGITPLDADFIIKRVHLRTQELIGLSEREFIAALKNEVITILDSYKKIDLSNQNAIAFVGATGVGKTSIVMKMAINKSIFSNQKIAIVNTDLYRMGTKQTYQNFCKLTGIPFFEAYEKQELQRILQRLKKLGYTVLIDTPGRSPFFPEYFKELGELLKCSKSAPAILIVVSAASDLEDIVLNLSLYSLLEPIGMIVTKIDETTRPGKIFSVARAFELPVLFLSSGQHIPSDLEFGSGVAIWEKIEKYW